MSDSATRKTMRKLPSASLVISFCSLLIALCSLVLTLYSGYFARYHNRLSVTPRLYFVSERTDQDPQVGLLLSNSGLGPALIKSWTVSLDDKPVGMFSDGFKKALKELKLPEGTETYYSSFLLLEAGKSAFIFSIDQEQWKKLDSQKKQAFNDAMKRIKVVIDYDSVYDEHNQRIYDGAKEWELHG